MWFFIKVAESFKLSLFTLLELGTNKQSSFYQEPPMVELKKVLYQFLNMLEPAHELIDRPNLKLLRGNRSIVWFNTPNLDNKSNGKFILRESLILLGFNHVKSY